MTATQFATVDDYIASFPDDVQRVLQEVRRTMREIVPEAAEKISYGIPTLILEGRYLVYFAGWKNHISVYPLPAGDQALDEELAPYKSGKGTARFSLKEPIPHDLIRRLVALLTGQRAGA
jgi:uncharacterized protein YdhG (YjbR/CyaY superfamily)